MCGIAAVARLDGRQLDEGSDALLSRIADLLAHRGPDDRELLRDGPVGLAFTRLSLVDPVGGGQPLVSDDGNLVLVVNGEVYNHRQLAATLPGVTMRTRSDCEVLLYLYRQHGLRFLDAVRGMFGLILWDRGRGRLVLARDRFGIKPLYYHRDATRIVLGSEITSLFADPGTPRRLNWAQALTTPLLAAAPYFTDEPPATWFEGIESVPAGTILDIDLRDGTTREHRYWTFPGNDDYTGASADELVAAYRDVLRESVEECATADAEVGLFLSGGIDSSAVAVFAAQTTELHTFSVLAASTYLNGDAEHAHRVAAKLGLPNHQVLFAPARVPGVAEWKRLLWLLETPMCGPEVFYKHELHRYAKAVRPELRGMLLGAASDEFNGGYTVDSGGEGGWPAFEQAIRGMARGGRLRHRPDLSPWWTYGDRPLLTDEVVRRYAAAFDDDPYPSYLRWHYGTIQQYNVWHEDRTAAGSGIEARVPFLDHRLVEISAGVPAHLRPRLLWDKQILREAMRGILPDETVERPKGPFFYGEGEQHTSRMVLAMLAQEDAALVEEALAAPEAGRLIDGDAVRATLRDLAGNPVTAQVEVTLRVLNLGLLAAMTAALPAPTRDTPVGVTPQELPVADWEIERMTIERAVGVRRDLDADLVPALADGVLLLTDARQRAYVAVDGGIEYVIDPDDDPHVLAVLRAIDGIGTLHEVATRLGRPPAKLSATMSDLIDKGLVVDARAAASPAETGR